MSDLKKSALWAIAGVIILLIAFGTSIMLLHKPIVGYKILAGPGIVTLRLFSEELPLWPKIIIASLGQYLAYFLVILATKKIIRLLHKPKA